MKTSLIAVSAIALTLIACNRPSPPPGGPVVPPKDGQLVSPQAPGRDVDNTAQNVRDRNSNALTPGSQSEKESDRTMTADIRRALMKNDALSSNAKNVKIITINGIVTLRGVVDSPEEKAAIERSAQSVNGVSRVDNQLDVKAMR